MDYIEGGEVVLEPDLQKQHEIEIDEYGNLYVLSTQALNDNDWILVYDSATDAEQRILISDSIEGATAMLVSEYDDTMYLTSTVQFLPDANDTRIYSYDILRDGSNMVTGIQPSGYIEITNPTPEDLGYGHGHFTTITAIDENPSNGMLYATGFTGPRLAPDYRNTNSNVSLFTTPTLAVISHGQGGTVEAYRIVGSDLALPLSIVWAGVTECIQADITGDGDVDFEDFGVLASQWLDLPDIPSADIALPLNNFVDIFDLAIIAEFWLQTNCN